MQTVLIAQGRVQSLLNSAFTVSRAFLLLTACQRAGWERTRSWEETTLAAQRDIPHRMASSSAIQLAGWKLAGAATAQGLAGHPLLNCFLSHCLFFLGLVGCFLCFPPSSLIIKLSLSQAPSFCTLPF